MRVQILLALLSLLLVACASKAQPVHTTAKPVDRSSYDRLNQHAPVEDVEIQLSARRSGHSLVVDIRGIGRGHQSGQALEDSKEWQITANDGSTELKQVLAGPAKVSREPTGAALGSQWNIDVRFMVAFALPDRAAKIEVRVQAPNGKSAQRSVAVDAPLQKLSAL